MSLAAALVSIAVLISAAGTAIAALLARRRAGAIARRIEATHQTAANRDREAPPSTLLPSADGLPTPLAHLLDGMGLREKAERLVASAGLNWGASGLARASAACFIGACGGALLLTGGHQPLACVFAGGFGAWLPVWHVARKARARVARFEDQFPDFLQFVSRSMRAGHAFTAALGMAHREFSPPIAVEFRRAFEESNLGQPMDAVLVKLALRVPSLDVRFFASAVMLHKRTGGNLAELLDKLASLMRERSKLRAKVRALTAQGIMTGRILVAIPGCVAALMAAINPTQFRFFAADPAGQSLLMGSAMLQVIGYLTIRHMVAMDL